MEVGDVLANTLSPDRRIRDDAVQKLEVAARDRFQDYLAMLSRELANEQSQPAIRTAAGLALKNALTAKDVNRRQEYQAKWRAMDDMSRVQIKESVRQLVERAITNNQAITTLHSRDTKAGQAAAQFISAIAAVELPNDQWPDLMPRLVANVSEGQPAHAKQNSLQSIGYICEAVDPELLTSQSNSILTAVVQGARREEPSAAVRLAAINALFDSLEFVRENFEREGERNYIMQVVCEATQSEDTQIQIAAYGCLVRIMQLYYEKMRFYMEKALFGLTVVGMKHQNEQVALQAVEFWSTVCEVEVEIALETEEV